MCFDEVRLGEVNRARDVHWCASGKVLNVAIALAHLGAPCEVVTLLGGSTGQAIERQFRSLGIAGHWVQTHWTTRICTTLLKPGGETTELVQNAGPITPTELDEFRTTYAQAASRADLVVLTGSLPVGVPATLFAELLRSSTAQAILDIRGPDLQAALECRPLLVKPNLRELEQTLGRTLSAPAALHQAMRELNERGARWVVISDGPEAVWASSADRVLRFAPPKVAVVNPIGAGDCLAAGIGWALADGEEPTEAIRLGIAAAVENVGQLLPGRIDPQRVRQRAEQIQIESA